MEPISSLESRILDANSEYFGVPRATLMENAGKKVAGEVLKFEPGRVVLLCGTGNNGGDGFIAARYLWDAGVEAEVVLLGFPQDIRTDEAWNNWIKLGGSGAEVSVAPQPEALYAEHLSDADVVVDAILGTGISGELRPLASLAVELANQSGKKILSVDCPTGLDPDTGKGGAHVNADVVVTFEGTRAGLGKFKQKAITIGVPPEARECVGPGDALRIEQREPGSHKGNNGRVLVIGGGPCSGAPALAATGALRAGADWVTVCVPSRWLEVVAGFAPDLIAKPFEGDVLAPADVPVLAGLSREHDVTVIGMGLGTEPQTREALGELLPQIENVVIDADALQPGLPLRGVITPHRGELSRLTGEKIAEGEGAVPAVAEYCQQHDVTVLLKGPADIITDGTSVKKNLSGHPGMTVGGTGDVLAGVVGALHCRTDGFTAACVGAFVNGVAGEIAAGEHGNGLTTGDIAGKVSEAMTRFDI